MLQKLRVNNFESIRYTPQFNEDFMKSYKKESDEGYFLEIDIQYLQKLHELHNDLPFLPERMKIENVEKHAAHLHDKTEYIIHIRKFKTGIKLWISFKNKFTE